MCAFYFFWLSASHGLRLGMDGMLLALCDHGFERSGLCAVNNNNNNTSSTNLFNVRNPYFIMKYTELMTSEQPKSKGDVPYFTMHYPPDASDNLIKPTSYR